MEEMGPLPQRAAMGDGARGLQRSGDAWNYFTHDEARSRAYRWGEDGLGGISAGTNREIKASSSERSRRFARSMSGPSAPSCKRRADKRPRPLRPGDRQ